jgi:hypothetical protein
MMPPILLVVNKTTPRSVSSIHSEAQGRSSAPRLTKKKDELISYGALKRNEIFSGSFRMAVNYWLNRVRFPHPVRPGSRVRNRAVLKSIERRGFRKVLVTIDNTIEIEGIEKPAVTAETLALIYL